jgi:hypothetical protein
MSSNLTLSLLLPFLVFPLAAQTAEPSEAMIQVLKRLDALESENRLLKEELGSLKQQMAGTQTQSRTPNAPPLEERVDVTEKRVAEQEQKKVESSQKFPLSLNGMLLFNAFSSGKPSSLYSSYSLLDGPSTTGATVGQSIIGLQFRGPSLPGGGRVNGSLTMDFWGARMASSDTGWLRIREADLSMDWKRRSLSFGQMKPLISPLQPTSLAEVAVPPLSGAGNLWYWLPQVRYEERVRLGSQSGVNLQAALLQTDEAAAYVAAAFSPSLQRARPGAEGRAAFWRNFAENRRLEIGGGFHISSTHVAGVSIPSHIASVDWSIAPLWKLQLSGTFYRGQNVASLGSLGNGFVVYRARSARAVQNTAGWTQLAIPITNRLTFDIFGGIESDGGSEAIVRNFTYASNLMYHLGPNVVLGLEALQSRLRYYDASYQLLNHYDVALAYIF